MVTVNPPGPVAAEARTYGSAVLVALILAAAVANLNLSVANVALPDIDAAFDASQTSLNLVAVGYSLGLAASVLYLGALGDRYGRRLALNGGLVVFGAASLFAVLSSSSGAVIGARAVMGAGAAFVMPATLSILAHVFPPRERPRAIAIASRDRSLLLSWERSSR